MPDASLIEWVTLGVVVLTLGVTWAHGRAQRKLAEEELEERRREKIESVRAHLFIRTEGERGVGRRVMVVENRGPGSAREVGVEAKCKNGSNLISGGAAVLPYALLRPGEEFRLMISEGMGCGRVPVTLRWRDDDGRVRDVQIPLP